MNLMFKIAGIFALFITISKIIVALGFVLPVIGFVAVNSSFMYGIAAGIGVAALSKNIWLMFLTIGAVYVLLTVAGF